MISSENSLIYKSIVRSITIDAISFNSFCHTQSSELSKKNTNFTVAGILQNLYFLTNRKSCECTFVVAKGIQYQMTELKCKQPLHDIFTPY